MAHVSGQIPEDRPLSPEEQTLVAWLLKHGNSRAVAALAQVDSARVVERCPCGCPSVDFSIDGVTAAIRSGMEVVSEFWWRTQRGNLCGAYVFLRADHLAGLDLWSIDGLEAIDELPDPQVLRPFPIKETPDA